MKAEGAGSKTPIMERIFFLDYAARVITTVAVIAVLNVIVGQRDQKERPGTDKNKATKPKQTPKQTPKPVPQEIVKGRCSV